MAKHTVVTMPGDGIGNQVLPEAIRVLDAVGFEAELRPRRHRLGVLAERGQRAARAHHRLAAAAQGRPVRRDHLEAEEGNRGRSRSRAEGQGPAVLQPHRLHAADLQPRHLHAALPVVPRQSAELHPQEARRRLRRAQGRRRGLPPEHRRTVRRSGVDEPAAAGARCAGDALQVQAFRQRARRRPGDFGAHHHSPGGAAHLRSGLPARAQVRLQVGHHLREAQRAARNLRHDGRGREGSAEAV